MNFDIKDVKSWKDRYDVKVGDDGYVSSDINTLQDDLKSGIAQIRIICHVRDDDVECFSCKAFGSIRNYGFFLPVEAVKEDKPKEKRYRPFRTITEVDDLLAKDCVKHYCFVGSDLYLRCKATPNIIKQISITSLEVDANTNELRFINGLSPKYMLNIFDIKLAGEWFPFGVEVEDEY